MEETRTLMKTEKPNSFETGKAGNRFKLFFETAEELAALIKDLTAQGFLVGEQENVSI